MTFELILMILLAISGVFFIGIPTYKIVKQLIPQKANPLKEAKVRLKVAKQEIEAAKLNKEAEKIYNELYNEVLQNDEDQESDRKKL